MQRVQPVEMMAEFIKPRKGLKDLPETAAQLLFRKVEGIREMACCWISKVLLVAFTNMIQKGRMLIAVRIISSR